MTALMPWAALLIAAALFLFRVGFSGKPILERLKRSAIPAAVPLCVGLGTLIVAWRIEPKFHGLFHLAIGALVGTLTAWATHLIDLEEHRTWRAAHVVTFATAALGMTHWFKEALFINMTQFGLVIGAVLLVLVLSAGKQGVVQEAPAYGALAITALMVCDNAGRHFGVHTASLTGLLIGLATTVGLIGATILLRRDPAQDSSVKRFGWSIIAAILLVAGGFLAGKRLIFVSHVAWLIVGGVVLAFVVNWLLSEKATSSLRFGIAAAIWLAGATVAYAEISVCREIGLTVFVASGALILIALQSPRALLSMGPVFGLVLYRLFRGEFPEASRSLDLGQHYAIVGMIAGLLLTLIAAEWLKATSEKTYGKGLCGIGIWIVLLVIVPIVGTLLIGPRGISGYMIGLGMAALIEGFKDTNDITVMSIGSGLSCLMLALYRWVAEYRALERQEKIATVGRYVLDIAALAILLVFLSKENKRRTE